MSFGTIILLVYCVALAYGGIGVFNMGLIFIAIYVLYKVATGAWSMK